MRFDQFSRFINEALGIDDSSQSIPTNALSICLYLYRQTVENNVPGWVTQTELAQKFYGTTNSTDRRNVKTAILRIRGKLADHQRDKPSAPKLDIIDNQGSEVTFRDDETRRLVTAYRLVIDSHPPNPIPISQAAEPETEHSSPESLSDERLNLSIPQIRWLPNRSPPGALLRADIDKPVPFHGREDELTDLVEWCSSNSEIACRLYTSPGGMGKTRLMVELCQRLPKPWSAGFLPDFSGTGPEAAWWSTATSSAPMLIVIDYAEHRRVDLDQLLSDILLSPAVHVRIALLARAADDWWTILKSTRGDVGDFLSGPTTQHRRLAPLAMTKELRTHSFHLAHAHFSKMLDANNLLNTVNLDIDFGAAHFDHALLLHMAALATVDGVTVAGENGILDYVLNRERRFWATQASARDIPAVLHRAVEQAIAILTLGGGASSRLEALDVLSGTPLLRDQDTATVNAIAEMLHALYPGNKWIEPLQPDLLGEHLADQALAEDKHGILQLLFRYR